MNHLEIVRAEARSSRTILLTARELDQSIETREVEPYSLRPGGAGQPGERLFYYCLKKNGTRNTYVANIIAAEPTGNTFVPRWDVEL